MHKERVTRLVARAAQGDEQAHSELALYCHNEFKYRLERFFASDPSIDQEDLEQVFFMGIWRHVPLADGRGSDTYHIAQRGVWAVMSYIRAVNKLQERRARFIPLALLEDIDGDEARVDVGAFADPVDPIEIVHDMLETDAIVRALVNANISPHVDTMVEAALEGDLDDDAYKSSLAKKLGVSPQRVSQMLKQIREAGIA